MKMDSPPVVGDVTTRVVQVKRCKLCNCAINDGGCSYECPMDYADRPVGTFLTVTYRRVDTLISIE